MKPATYPRRHLSRRNLASWLGGRFPEPQFAWADEIDDVFKAAGQAFVDARLPDMKAGQKQRILIAAMSTHSPLLRKHTEKQDLDIIKLAHGCRLIFQGAIDICRRSQRDTQAARAATKSRSAVKKPKANPTAIRSIDKSFDDNSIADCIAVKHELSEEYIAVKHEESEECIVVKRQRPEESEKCKLQALSKTIILKVPQSRPPNPPAEKAPLLSVLCSLHLFSELQSGNHFASVAHSFSSTSTIFDIIATLHDYGALPADHGVSATPKIVLLLKNNVPVSIKHDRSLQKHLLAATSQAAATTHVDSGGGEQSSIRIFIEDRSEAEQIMRSAEDLLASFLQRQASGEPTTLEQTTMQMVSDPLLTEIRKRQENEQEMKAMAVAGRISLSEFLCS
jgi:hypothetical protein